MTSPGVGVASQVVPPKSTTKRRIPDAAERKLALAKLREDLKGNAAQGWRHTYSADQREHIRDGLFFSEDPRWKFKFGFLLGLSVTIAVMGLLSDSTAVVIGAMLVAPLMTPVLGLSYCISASWGSKISASLRRVGLATVGAIVLAVLLARLAGDGHGQSEVIARTAPSFKDLIVGLAAGAAGAYATLRDDGSAALPGVGVAVALVPPLAVVGIMLEAGEIGLAGGAFLLYLANLGSIVLSAIAVWLGSGFVTSSRLKARPVKIAIGIVATVAVTVGISVLLRGAAQQRQRTAQLAADIEALSTATEDVVRDWLTTAGNSAELTLDAVTVDDESDTVIVKLIGSGDPPPSTDLFEPLSSVLGRPVTARVFVTLQTERSSGPEPAAPPTDEELAVERIRPLVDVWLASGQTVAEYKIRDLLVNDGLVTVELAGTTYPPPVEDLEALIDEELGDGFVVEVPFTETIRAVPTTVADIAELDEAGVAAEAARLWIAALATSPDPDRPFVPDMAVLGTHLLTESLVVDLVGTTAPDPEQVSELQVGIVEALGYGTDVVVRFTQRLTLPGTTTTTTSPTTTSTTTTSITTPTDADDGEG